MRVISREEYPERHAWKLATRRRVRGCRVALRVRLFMFLMPGLHRPAGCAHWHQRMASHPEGWAGERP